MKNSFKYFLFYLILLNLNSFAQNETKKWYFGGQAGLDFTTNPPTILTNGSMSVSEGCSSIADAAGNLLFYTDGVTVWNQSHSVMANGNGLLGGGTPGQSSIIIKKPGSANLYYIFTVQGMAGAMGINYSIVNMTLAAGQGSVITLNAPLYNNSCAEKITATRHCNGVDYWVVVNDGVYNFRSYLLTAAGVNTTAVVSPIGSTSSCYCIKISPNGKKLGSTLATFVNGFELFDYDNSTGIVSNLLSLPTTTTGYSYGCEFSPDGTKFYGGLINGRVLQWDLCAGTNSAIVSSLYFVTTASNFKASFQLAPDGKIYIAKNLQSSLGVINNPNISGSGCNYVDAGQSVFPKLSQAGLPNFIGSSFIPQPISPPFTHTVSNNFGCQTAAFNSALAPSQTVVACSASGFSLTNLVWDFGDPSSGINNLSTLANPTHAFTNLGTYTVQLILYYSCGGGTDTLRQTVNINQPCISVTSNSITCASLGSATVTTSSGIGPFNYTWMPSGQTNSIATGLSPGTYTLSVFDFGSNITLTTTINFTSLIPLTGNLNNSSSITCNGAATGTANYTNLAGGSGNQNYLWSNGVNTYTVPNPNLLSAGLWSATVTDALTGCSVNNMFFITQPPALTLNITANTPTACAGSSIALSSTVSGGTPGYTFTWLAGPLTDSYTVIENLAGTYVYTLNVNDSYSCGITQTVSVDFIANPTLTLNNTSICPLEVGTLSVSGATSYTWSNNTTGSTFTASPLVGTQYSVSGSALGCTAVDSAFIFVKVVPNPVISVNSPVCQAATLSLSCNSGTAYIWSGVNSFAAFSQNNNINPVSLNHAGVYNVTVTAANSCTASTSATVVVKPLPTLTISPNSPSICANTTSVALNASGTATLFNWQPNQSLSATNTQSILAYPSLTKVYTLTGSLNGCTLQTTATVNVVPPPNPLIALSSATTCAQALNGSPNTITLTSSGANTYTLSTPNHIYNPNPSGPNSPINMVPPYLPTGPATATLYGSNGVCTISTTAVFTIIPNPSITVNSYTPVICAGQTFTYTNSGASSYTWSSATPGQTVYTTGSVSVASPSINSVFSVFGGSLGCNSALQTSSITVNPLPIVNISPNPTFVCLGSEVNLIAAGTGTLYNWQPPSFLNATTGAQVTSKPPQQIKYTVISTLNTCTNSAMVTVSVMPLPSPSITANTTTLCINQKLILQGFGATHYSWLLPDRSTITAQSMSLIVNNSIYSGTYTLIASDANACYNNTTTSIKVENLPSGYLQAANNNACVPFCGDYSFVPSGTTTNTISGFNWQINNKSISTQNKFSYCFTNAGTYIVTGDLTANSGCANSVSLQIIAYPKPIADFTYTPEKPIENFEEVNFISTNKDQHILDYKWQFLGSSGQQSSAKESPNFLFETAGTYPVALIITNDFQCKDTIVKTITVASDFAVYVPNAFTPNDDNKNETFNAVTRGVKKYSLVIFNRWGQKVFESTDLNTGWDGTYHSEPCPTGVYAWKISATSADGVIKELTGQVTVYR